MKAFKIFLLAFSFWTSLFDTKVSASDIPIEGAFLCQLHFCQYAYGKRVKKVIAHMGVERDCNIFERTDPYWIDVHDVYLALSPDLQKFTEKKILRFTSSTYQPCTSRPMIQFWITYEDGTSQIEAPVVAKVDKAHFITDIQDPSGHESQRILSEFRHKPLGEIESVYCTELLSYGDATERLVGE